MSTTVKTSSRIKTWLAGFLTCWGGLGQLFLAGLVGAPLMAVAPSASAACLYTGGTTSTYTYTAANLGSAAALPFSGSWNCYFSGSSIDHSAYICYMTSSTNTLIRSAGGSMTFSSAVNDGTNHYSPMASGTWYGRGTTPGNTLNTTFTVTVPAGQAGSVTPGTYTNTNVRLYLDEQANGGSCEGATSGWDSGNTTFAPIFVIPSSCQVVSTSAINFGNINQIGTLGTAVAANGTILVNCTNRTPYTVYLGDGQHRVNPGSGDRRMANGSALLNYQLYKDSGHASIWDATGLGAGTNGSGGVNQTGSGANQTFTVYGRIPQGAAIPGTTGNYTDTVVVTVAY